MIGSARARRWLDQLLHTHDTPERTAAAYAVGVFFGFSPFLGLHTLLGLVVAFTFNLNRVAVLLGVYSNLPWILPACTRSRRHWEGTHHPQCPYSARILEGFAGGADRCVVGRVPDLHESHDSPADMVICPRFDDRRRRPRRNRLPCVAYDDCRPSTTSRRCEILRRSSLESLSRLYTFWVPALTRAPARRYSGSPPAAEGWLFAAPHDVALAFTRAQDRRNRNRSRRVCLPVRSHDP